MNFIINPTDNKKYSIFSKQGKQLLKSYITNFNGGIKYRLNDEGKWEKKENDTWVKDTSVKDTSNNNNNKKYKFNPNIMKQISDSVPIDKETYKDKVSTFLNYWINTKLLTYEDKLKMIQTKKKIIRGERKLNIIDTMLIVDKIIETKLLDLPEKTIMGDDDINKYIKNIVNTIKTDEQLDKYKSELMEKINLFEKRLDEKINTIYSYFMSIFNTNDFKNLKTNNKLLNNIQDKLENYIEKNKNMITKNIYNKNELLHLMIVSNDNIEAFINYLKKYLFDKLEKIIQIITISTMKED